MKDYPYLVLTGKEAEKFARTIKHPPKANKALREILKEIKRREMKLLKLSILLFILAMIVSICLGFKGEVEVVKGLKQWLN